MWSAENHFNQLIRYFLTTKHTTSIISSSMSKVNQTINQGKPTESYFREAAQQISCTFLPVGIVLASLAFIFSEGGLGIGALFC